ncbi:outer membrane beta-barrel protein [Haloferula sp. BvORR071]|uniref:outer membrane beta-barrel protein n=1 Tax=Haloferula sp. BvORR071 TaxID=1396141 RepID=UPI0005586144|nr:outer membrane beta-barrel protein [Haloferula sp. BvORR071]
MTGSLVYDSNFFQTSSNEEDEVTFTISPTLSFRTEGTRFKVIGQAALNYNTYFENSDFNGLGYQFSLEAQYSGAALTATASIDSSKEQGVNRYYGGLFVETLNMGAHLGASYRVGPRTTIDGGVSYSWSDPDQGNLSTSENLNFDLSAMWQATPLIRIGPGVSWRLEKGSNQADRETIGPMLRAQYQLSNRISFDGRVGLDFVDYQGGTGGSDTDFSCSLGMAYRWSEIWGMNLTVYHGTTADGSALGSATGSYRETTSVTVGYNRRIMRALWDIDMTYSMDDSTSPNGLFGPGSTDYFSIHTSLGMPIFANRANASIFYSWSQESGNALRDWSGHQLGFQISSSF